MGPTPTHRLRTIPALAFATALSTGLTAQTYFADVSGPPPGDGRVTALETAPDGAVYLLRAVEDATRAGTEAVLTRLPDQTDLLSVGDPAGRNAVGFAVRRTGDDGLVVGVNRYEPGAPFGAAEVRYLGTDGTVRGSVTLAPRGDTAYLGQCLAVVTGGGDVLVGGQTSAVTERGLPLPFVARLARDGTVRWVRYGFGAETAAWSGIAAVEVVGEAAYVNDRNFGVLLAVDLATGRLRARYEDPGAAFPGARASAVFEVRGDTTWVASASDRGLAVWYVTGDSAVGYASASAYLLHELLAIGRGADSVTVFGWDLYGVYTRVRLGPRGADARVDRVTAPVLVVADERLRGQRAGLLPDGALIVAGGRQPTPPIEQDLDEYVVELDFDAGTVAPHYEVPLTDRTGRSGVAGVVPLGSDVVAFRQEGFFLYARRLTAGGRVVYDREVPVARGFSAGFRDAVRFGTDGVAVAVASSDVRVLLLDGGGAVRSEVSVGPRPIAFPLTHDYLAALSDGGVVLGYRAEAIDRLAVFGADGALRYERTFAAADGIVNVRGVEALPGGGFALAAQPAADSRDQVIVGFDGDGSEVWRYTPPQGVRYAALERTPDGRLVAIPGSRSRITVVSADGAELSDVSGPGDFRSAYVGMVGARVGYAVSPTSRTADGYPVTKHVVDAVAVDDLGDVVRIPADLARAQLSTVATRGDTIYFGGAIARGRGAQALVLARAANATSGLRASAVADAALRLSPNPLFGDELLLDAGASLRHVELVDALGRRSPLDVAEGRADLGRLAPGTYVVLAEGADGRRYRAVLLRE